MSTQSFSDYILLDVLSGMSGLRARKMFGAEGLYRDGVIWGLVENGELLVYVFPEWEELLGDAPKLFTYERDGKSVSMNYGRINEDALENSELMREVVERAVEARREAKRKRK